MMDTEYKLLNIACGMFIGALILGILIALIGTQNDSRQGNPDGVRSKCVQAQTVWAENSDGWSCIYSGVKK